MDPQPPMDLQPLKVTFELCGAMVEPEHPIHLDALMAYAVVQRHGGNWQLQEHLPLARAQRDGQWVWKASALALTRHGLPYRRHFLRRTDIESYASARGHVLRLRGDKIVTSRGPLKNCLLTYPLIDVSQAFAWCVGDPVQVQSLLGELRFLGKRTRLGHGEIKAVHVSEDAAAQEYWQRRVLPWDPGDDASYEPVVSGHRPPYWDATKWRKCWQYTRL